MTRLARLTERYRACRAAAVVGAGGRSLAIWRLSELRLDQLVPSLHGLGAGVFLSVLPTIRLSYMPVAAVPPLDPAFGMSPRRWARRRGSVFPGGASRSCGWPFCDAVRCWWPCICWRNMVSRK